MRRIVAGLFATLPVAVAAAAQPPARPGTLSPPVAIAKLRESEAKVASGELRLVATSRSVRWDGDVDEVQAREELERRGREYGRAATTLRFTAAGWREEGLFTAPEGVSRRLATSAAYGLRREVSVVGSRVRAQILRDLPGPAAVPGALLRSQLGELLKDVPWKKSETAGRLVILRGEWLGRSLALTLDPGRGCRPVAVAIVTRRMDAPAPTSVQVTRVTYPAGADPTPARVEQLRISPLGEGATASLHQVIVEERQLNVPVAPDALQVAIPKGAEVVDQRAGTAVYYQQGDADLPLSEVQALAERQLAERMPVPVGGPKLGAPAPAVALKTLEGKEAQLADYRGKVVLLNWFASW